MLTKLEKEMMNIAYKRGFIDGVNAEKKCNNDDEISDEEFEKLGFADIIKEAIEKTEKKFENL